MKIRAVTNLVDWTKKIYYSLYNYSANRSFIAPQALFNCLTSLRGTLREENCVGALKKIITYTY